MKNFNEACYELLKKVPRGKVTTYKEIAHALGTGAYRAVGNAMNKNPHNITEVPCHRVVNSDGRIGGYAWREEDKIKRLKSEGIDIEINSEKLQESKIKNFNKVLFKFN